MRGASSRIRSGTRSCHSRAGSMRWSSTETNQLSDMRTPQGLAGLESERSPAFYLGPQGLLRRPAPVDDDGLARDVAAGVAHQPHDRADDVVDRAVERQRRVPPKPIVGTLRVVEHI